MNIIEATSSYETWLRRHVAIIEADLDLKHRKMRESSFPFLRATFYRWAEQFPEICPDLIEAPRLLAVGDLHIENFGTWRDAEGRLVWGVNDFDEAAVLPYTNDLVRLATSACLAITAGNLPLGRKDACGAILAGYQERLAAGGRPFVLAERHKALREMALKNLKDPADFWGKLAQLTDPADPVPADAEEALRSMLPEPTGSCRITARQAGVGSLGRPRYVAVADFLGGSVARECKALAPSAAVWADGTADGEILYQTILDRAVRCPDPFIRVHGNWIVRRLAPESTKIEFGALLGEKDLKRLLEAMGHETANVHLGEARTVQAITADLTGRSEGWLHKAAVAMTAATDSDWQTWKVAA